MKPSRTKLYHFRAQAASDPCDRMKALHSWHEEQRSAYLYRLLAELEAGTTD